MKKLRKLIYENLLDSFAIGAVVFGVGFLLFMLVMCVFSIGACIEQEKLKTELATMELVVKKQELIEKYGEDFFNK